MSSSRLNTLKRAALPSRTRFEVEGEELDEEVFLCAKAVGVEDSRVEGMTPLRGRSCNTVAAYRLGQPTLKNARSTRLAVSSLVTREVAHCEGV